jgi:preprotein translocase subunit SecA
MTKPYRRKDKEILGKKVRPNDPCPCGSGKKVKKCHRELL